MGKNDGRFTSEYNTFGRKTNDYELEERIGRVTELLILNKSNQEIYKIMADEFGINQRPVDVAIKASYNRLKEEHKELFENFRDVLKSRLEALYQQSLDEKMSMKSKLSIMDQLNKITGNYEQNINVNVEGKVEFDFGE